MNNNSPKNEPVPLTRTDFSETLTHWIKTSCLFEANYKALSALQRQYSSPAVSLRTSVVPACAPGELTLLLTTMKDELLHLLLDIDLSATDQNQLRRRLEAHSSRLQRLNQRAQRLLDQLVT